MVFESWSKSYCCQWYIFCQIQWELSTVHKQNLVPYIKIIAINIYFWLSQWLTSKLRGQEQCISWISCKAEKLRLLFGFPDEKLQLFHFQGKHTLLFPDWPWQPTVLPLVSAERRLLVSVGFGSGFKDRERLLKEENRHNE